MFISKTKTVCRKNCQKLLQGRTNASSRTPHRYLILKLLQLPVFLLTSSRYLLLSLFRVGSPHSGWMQLSKLLCFRKRHCHCSGWLTYESQRTGNPSPGMVGRLAQQEELNFFRGDVVDVHYPKQSNLSERSMPQSTVACILLQCRLTAFHIGVLTEISK